MREITNIKLLFQLARYVPEELQNKDCEISLLCLDVGMMFRTNQYAKCLLSQEKFEFTSDLKGMFIQHSSGDGKTLIIPTVGTLQPDDISDDMMVVTYLAMRKGYAANWKWGKFNDCTAEEWNNQ